MKLIIEDLVINNNLTKSDFLLSQISKNGKLKIENENYTSYEIGPVIINGEKINLSLYFSKEQITEVDLYIFLSEESISWDDLSKANEMKRKSKQEKWLADTYNIPGKYTASWGSISSVYDEKSGFSHILIKFNSNVI